jgi:hypothetical protein
MPPTELAFLPKNPRAASCDASAVSRAYTVTVEISDADLRALGGHDVKLAVCKSPRGVPPSVVWLAWQPLRLNTLSWSETYGIFAAEVPDRPQEPIKPMVQIHPARQRAVYRFSGDAFAGPFRELSVPHRHYGVYNEASFAAGFGLLQSVTLNYTRLIVPVNLAVLPPGFVADFTAVDTFHLWLQRRVIGGTIITSVPSGSSLVLAETGGVQHYRYDAEQGSFLSLDDPL